MKPKFSPAAREAFERRYRYKDESPEGMLRRVANAVAEAEEKDKKEWADRFYELMASQRFLPNSPTLFNAGTGEGLLSACFLFVVEDSMVDIMECHRLAGLVQKYGGGVGYVLSHIRPQGKKIASVQGRACGPVALLAYFNALAELITQGGKRAGAQMGMLSVEHSDVNRFISAKSKDPDKLSTFNISVALTDEVMQKAKEGTDRQLLKRLATAAWRTGDPGCFFIDRVNRDNSTPWLGKLEGTNPCGEVPLLHAEACNLGSLNVAKYALVGTSEPFNWEQMRQDVALAVRFLDDVITVNSFPDPTITEAVHQTRKIGLGLMGWADALALLEINYDSIEAADLAEHLISNIAGAADEADMDLGLEKGPAPCFDARPEYEGPMYRNASRLSIAPTGSIALLAGCSTGIEPHYQLEYVRRMQDKGQQVELKIQEPIVAQLEKKGSSFKPRTALEIAPEWHIRHQAAFQKYVDLAVSKTINIPESAKVQDVEQAFLLMWEMGCKGGTIYRDKSRDQQVLGELRRKVGERRRLPDTRRSVTHRFVLDDQKGYVVVGMYENGEPGEMFITIAKEGSALAGAYDAFALMVSLSLQYGVPFDSIASKLIGTRFEPSGRTKNPDIPTATSIPDYLFRWLTQTFGEKAISVQSGQPCPTCGSDLIYQEGCLRCGGCDFARC